MDTLTPEDRRRTMAAVHSKDTKPELTVRKALHAMGMRYLLHDKRFPGKPDLIFPKYHTAVFVHGCFWHGHKRCRRKSVKIPSTNPSYWEKKIAGNIRRDFRNAKTIRENGWKVINIWECQISENSIKKLALKIKSG
ncbi:MAG: DNA mismatch endonuclease Vsr [Deltaproteobacteria bacterium]|nr:DNA mismatch endonuclease Vsr [Deltaproteobacteria bacterium]